MTDASVLGATKPAPVETEALTLMLGDRVLLDRATLRVERGQVLAITGGAGSGKTALLGALAGQLPAGVDMAGTARVDGHLLIAQGGRLAPRRPLALQVAEVVGHHLGLDLRSSLRRMADGLDRMGVPAAARRFDLPPEQLPEQLRWACLFAMAVAVGPAVLLADAPAAGLDPTVRLRLLHRLADWARADGVALILAGRPEDGLAGPADWVLALRRARLLPPNPARTEPLAPLEPPGAARLHARGLGMSYPLAPGPGGKARSLAVLHGIDLDLRTGETLALLGETGSAKATLARSLLCLPPPTAGAVVWMGRDLMATAAPPAAGDANDPDRGGLRRARRDLQPLFPDPAASFDPAMTLGAQFGLVLESLRPDIAADRRDHRIDEALEEAGLRPEAALRWPSALSVAEAAHAGLARAILSEPRVLVADEPASSLSAEERETFLDTLMAVRDRRRLSLVLATERYDEGLRDAHRGVVMLAGRVVESADAGTLRTAPLHPYSRAMLAAAQGERPALEGDAPSAFAQPAGCPLRRRCPLAREFCAQAVPTLEEVAPGHHVACHYWDTPADG
ncbi:oligopeptide/dipeptide ABC transporter ATP-binding protein [Azospirillum sp. 11R-A]|uniref:ABC transporter ATP-binding protein n=2 Tax=unclassified Azospirillum TaxID=2630922 RepID=UPI003C17C398